MEEQNYSEKYVIRQFEDAHVIWFRQSKSFLLLEEPAYYVFKLYQEEKSIKEINKICQDRYAHLEGNIPQFAKEIMENIDYYDESGNTISISKLSLVENEQNVDSFLEMVQYQMGPKAIEISYGDENIKFAIHPLYAHMKSNGTTDVQNGIECFEKNGLFILKHNGVVIEAFSTKNVEYFTGAVRQLLYSILFDLDYYDWMTMLHASGVYSKNQAILFSAASGSGKSTISAILKAKGYGYLSDDLIGADNSGRAYPFPAAISVKEGAVSVLSEYYPELLDTKTEETFIGKMVKYIPVQNIENETLDGIPVKAFVFVNFSKTDEFIFEEVDKKHALQILLKETWVNPQSEYVSGFFDWINNTNFYKLQYSKTEEALEVVKKIFND